MEDIALNNYTQTEDVERAMDRRRCAMVGSTALQRFMRAEWEPSDFDIACKCDSYAEWRMLVENYLRNVRVTGKAASTFLGVNEPLLDIVETVNIKIEGIAKPVQIVGIMSTAESLPDLITRTTDKPACVSYTLHASTGERIFHLSESCLEAIATKKLAPGSISAARAPKYRARGFDIE
jgi:hypothetical protein